ncbi:hypothetical protein SSX86_009828 [Deinandra increscens subsp. villosa]|uniref:Uncharacterized protein n=1 Tax=Deinandra increscens subsp. villosa TaxID=3103831 RepID=A0AAP0D9Y2_9ASTR
MSSPYPGELSDDVAGGLTETPLGGGGDGVDRPGGDEGVFLEVGGAGGGGAADVGGAGEEVDGDGVSGSIDEIKKLARLKKLEILDLSSNSNINRTILASLAALTSLRVLDLSNIRLEGPFPIKELGALDNLETLSLTGCIFNGFERAFVSNKLETLILNDNHFNESILSSIKFLPSLKNLDLRGNDISGPFPPRERRAATHVSGDRISTGSRELRRTTATSGDPHSSSLSFTITSRQGYQAPFTRNQARSTPTTSFFSGVSLLAAARVSGGGSQTPAENGDLFRRNKPATGGVVRAIGNPLPDRRIV